MNNKKIIRITADSDMSTDIFHLSEDIEMEGYRWDFEYMFKTIDDDGKVKKTIVLKRR